jgi:LuxR family maltose regulon positive regulatory protein
VAALLVHTEGWPAAAYRSSLTLGQVSQRRRELIRLSVQDAVVADYLRDMVLAILPLDEQRFLIRTSILTRMSAPLCDAVLAVSGSADTLRGLAQRNIFVIQLDNRAQWYRYHGMFRDMLQRVAAQQDSQTLVTLHARASRWLETAGEYAEAIDHARLARQVARAAHLIWSRTPTLLASGDSETLRRWLGGFTNEQVIGHAELALTAAWCALETGRSVDHWIESVERGVFDATEPGESSSIHAAIALLRAQRGRNNLSELREEAARALELQASDDLWRPYAQYLHAAAALMMDLPDEARVKLTATERLAVVLGLPAHAALCLAQLAALEIESANWDAAGRLADASSSTMVDHGIGDSPIISLVHCVMTVVLAKRRYADDAKRLARRCMRMVALADQCPPWMAVQTRYLLGRAHLLLGDTAAARVLLSEAQSHMRATPDAVWLQHRLNDAWTHVEKFPLATGVGPSALTSAELRVLQLLPTHLSFEQIGKRLYISRNTVKTQAIATYRKLGVSSRGEAVKRARSLGMIQL